MRGFRLAIVVLLFLVLIESSMADTVPQARIDASGCRFTTANTTLGCGQSMFYSCDVFDRWTGANITSVEYTLHRNVPNGVDQTYMAAIYAGNNTIGTWRSEVEVSVPPAGSQLNGSADSYSLTYIQITDSAGHTCHAAPGNQPYSGCSITIESSSQPILCTCGGVSFGACGINDKMTGTLSGLDPACSGSGTTINASCNYCDPNWLSYYQGPGCQLPKVNGDMWGSGVPNFVHAVTDNATNGAACCQATGGPRYNHYGGIATDCVAPPTEGQASLCMLDAWLGRGKSMDSMNLGYSLYGAPNFFKLPAVQIGTDKVQPLVADLDADNVSEIIVYQGSDVAMFRFDKTAGSGQLEQGSLVQDYRHTLSDGQKIVGQPAVVGLQFKNYRGNGTGAYTCSNSSDFPSCGELRLAAFVTDANQTVYWFKLYDWQINEIYSYSLPSSPDNSGITCNRRFFPDDDAEGFSCYFSTQDRMAYKITGVDKAVGSITVHTVQL